MEGAAAEDDIAAAATDALLYAHPTFFNITEGGAMPDPNSGFGVLFNAMIFPFTVGPLAVSSFTWWPIGGGRAKTTSTPTATIGGCGGCRFNSP